MNRVVVESAMREEIEISPGEFSLLTFDVIERIGVIPEVHKIGERIEYFYKTVIHPEVKSQFRLPICFRLVSSIDDVDGTLVYPIFVEAVEPFSTPWKTYLQLPIEMVERLKQRARDENEVWIKEQIEKHNAEWILVVNKEVITYSKNRKDYPSKEELKNLAEKYNLFPFIFFRPPLIEESSWAKTRYKDDYYPTVKISICGTLNLAGDLDTGNPTTTLDRDRLISSTLLKKEHIDIPLQKGTFHNRPYEYSVDIIHIQITDEKGKKEARFIRCECVKDWQKNPFCIVNSQRKALMGRDILLEFPLEVRLNGKEQKTYLYLI